MTSDTRIAAYWFGRIAEYATILYLMGKGYRILGHRHRTPFGEIDLVCLKANTLVIVEVKARKKLDIAATALAPKQQARLRSAAASLISSHPHHAGRAIRFDCCAVTWYMRIRHIRNAFS